MIVRLCRTDSKKDDTHAICDIYNHYIANTIISFEQQLLTPSVMQARIAKVTQHYPWLVIEQENNAAVLGFAYADLWQSRVAYRHTLITTVYLHPDHTGRGFGKQLYKALFAALASGDTHILVAGIALPNAASVALHESLGFEKVAHFKEVGNKMGRWIDVGYWQRNL